MPLGRSGNGAPPRVLVCWSGYASYLDACLQALADQAAVRVLYASNSTQAPYEIPTGRSYAATAIDGHNAPVAAIDELVGWQPDITLINSWHFGTYRKLARRLKGASVRILCMDNRYTGTLRQQLGVLAAPFYIRPLYEGVFLPGPPQLGFARRLRFQPTSTYTGLYATDPTLFQRSAPVQTCRRFLFVGRLVEDKGVSELLAAYAAYRSSVVDPWSLLIAGTGPLAARVEGHDGVDSLGFVQPSDLPAVMNRAACLLLPSHFEPWGVVIHEAASAGLVIVASDAVGAATGGLVDDGESGYLFPAGEAGSLADRMRRVHTRTDVQLQHMSQRSEALAAQLTPQRWAGEVLIMAEREASEQF